MVAYRIFLAVSILGLQLITTDAIDKSMLKCKGLDITVTEEQWMTVKDCAKTVGIEGHRMNIAQISCLSKCIFQHRELVDLEGMPHKENIVKAVDKAMPETAKIIFTKAMEDCLDEYSKHVNPTEEHCESYGPLAICAHKAFIEICREGKQFHER